MANGKSIILDWNVKSCSFYDASRNTEECLYETVITASAFEWPFTSGVSCSIYFPYRIQEADDLEYE